jgi:hypothetical protein
VRLRDSAGARTGSVPAWENAEGCATVEDRISVKSEEVNCELDCERNNLAGVNKDEVGWGVCDCAGAGVAAHAPGT